MINATAIILLSGVNQANSNNYNRDINKPIEHKKRERERVRDTFGITDQHLLLHALKMRHHDLFEINVPIAVRGK